MWGKGGKASSNLSRIFHLALRETALQRVLLFFLSRHLISINIFTTSLRRFSSCVGLRHYDCAHLMRHFALPLSTQQAPFGIEAACKRAAKIEAHTRERRCVRRCLVAHLDAVEARHLAENDLELVKPGMGPGAGRCAGRCAGAGVGVDVTRVAGAGRILDPKRRAPGAGIR